MQEGPNFDGADPDFVQIMHDRLSAISANRRLSVCGAASAETGFSASSAFSPRLSRQPSDIQSRRPSRMDFNLSADIGIPVYKSLSDSDDVEEAEPLAMVGQESVASSSLSMSWLPTLLATKSCASAKTSAWEPQLPRMASRRSSGRSTSTSSIVVPSKFESACHSLDFVIRPSQDQPMSSGSLLDAERSRSGGQTRSRYSRIRRMIFFMLEDPFGSRHATCISAVFILAIFAGISFSVLEYTPFCKDQETGCRRSAFQWTVTIFYTVEVLLRFWCCPRTYGFFTYLPNVVDSCNSIDCWLSVVIPLSAQADWPMLKLMRHFEAGLRLLKLCRYLSSWQILCATLMDSTPALLLPIAGGVILVALGAGLLLVAERSTATSEAMPAGIVAVSGLYDAILFCMLCLVSTQSGPFNGINVQSSAGNVIVGLLMVCGHIIFAMPITIIGTCFCRTWFQRDRVLFTKVVQRRLKWQGGEASATLRQLFSRFTSGDADVLGLEEFYRFVAAIIPSPSQNQVLALFSTFDQDQDGFIGFTDLHASIYPEVGYLEMCGLLMADAPGNDSTPQYHSSDGSDAASESEEVLDEELGAICKTMKSFERRLLVMLDQCLRLLERDQHSLATAPWVSPTTSSALTPRRERHKSSSSRATGSASISFMLPVTRPSLAVAARPSLARKPSVHASISQRPSDSMTVNPSSSSASLAMSSLWSMLPSSSSISSMYSGRLLRSQTSSLGFSKSGSSGTTSNGFCPEGIGSQLDSSAPQQQAPKKRQSVLQMWDDGRDQVRSVSTTPSESRRPSQSRRPSHGNGRPALKRQATLTRMNLTIDDEDELTPALQPTLAGSMRLVTARNAGETSARNSPRGYRGSPQKFPPQSPGSISNSSSLNPREEQRSHSHSSLLQVLPSSSSSSRHTLVSLPVSMRIRGSTATRWKKRLHDKTIAAKSRVSAYARRWRRGHDSSTGQSCGTLSNEHSAEIANGLV